MRRNEPPLYQHQQPQLLRYNNHYQPPSVRQQQQHQHPTTYQQPGHNIPRPVNLNRTPAKRGYQPQVQNRQRTTSTTSEFRYQHNGTPNNHQPKFPRQISDISRRSPARLNNANNNSGNNLYGVNPNSVQMTSKTNRSRFQNYNGTRNRPSQLPMKAAQGPKTSTPNIAQKPMTPNKKALNNDDDDEPIYCEIPGTPPKTDQGTTTPNSRFVKAAVPRRSKNESSNKTSTVTRNSSSNSISQNRLSVDFSLMESSIISGLDNGYEVDIYGSKRSHNIQFNQQNKNMEEKTAFIRPKLGRRALTQLDMTGRSATPVSAVRTGALPALPARHFNQPNPYGRTYLQQCHHQQNNFYQPIPTRPLSPPAAFRPYRPESNSASSGLDSAFVSDSERESHSRKISAPSPMPSCASSGIPASSLGTGNSRSSRFDSNNDSATKNSQGKTRSHNQANSSVTRNEIQPCSSEYGFSMGGGPGCTAQNNNQHLDDTASTVATEVRSTTSSQMAAVTAIRKGLLWQQREKIFSRWKERFFILTQDYLQCFKKSTSKISEMGGFIFKLKLSEIEDVELLDKKGYLTIGLSMGKEGKIYLRRTEGIREWFEALKNCVEKSKEKRGIMKSTKEFWSKKQFTDSSSMEQWILARKRIEKKYSYGGENPMNPDNAEVASIMTADTCNDLMSTVSTSAAAAFRSKTPGLEIFKSNLNVARKNPVTKVDYGFIDAPVTNTNTVKNINMGTSKSDSNKNNRNMKDTEGHPLKACASLEQESQRSDSVMEDLQSNFCRASISPSSSSDFKPHHHHHHHIHHGHNHHQQLHLNLNSPHAPMTTAFALGNNGSAAGDDTSIFSHDSGVDSMNTNCSGSVHTSATSPTPSSTFSPTPSSSSAGNHPFPKANTGVNGSGTTVTIFRNCSGTSSSSSEEGQTLRSKNCQRRSGMQGTVTRIPIPSSSNGSSKNVKQPETFKNQLSRNISLV